MTTLTYDELKTKYNGKPLSKDEVECTLLAKFHDGFLVNINNEWEGFIPNNQRLQSEAEEELKTFKALVISGPDKSDRYVVSQRAYKEKQVYKDLEKYKEESTPLKVKISRSVKGGAEVFINGARAFLPGRYIRLPGLSPREWSGQEIEILIEEINYEERKLILNQRAAWELERKKQAKQTLQNLKEGDIVEVPVVRITDFGVFVDLGGIDGLVPASELSWGRFNHPRDVVKISQVLRARVFRIERDKERVALSVKQLLGDPWEEVGLDWQIGKQLTGKVIGEANFGLFVELVPGIEALLHNSEIPEGRARPKEGESIEAKIIRIDLEQRRIGLTLFDVKEAEEKEDKTESVTKETSASEGTEGVSSYNVNEEAEISSNESISYPELQNTHQEETYESSSLSEDNNMVKEQDEENKE